MALAEADGAAPLAAVLLAGGPADDVAALAPGAPNKAFVPVAGITLARRGLDALRASPLVGRIVAVAPLVPLALRELARADEIRPAGPTMAQSLRTGLAGFAPDDIVIVAASDLPMLGTAAIAEFVGLARAARADVIYACVERSVHEARFPFVPHTWARLREGTYCGGGLVALRPRAFAALEGLLGRLGAARKNPLQLASIFGYDVLARYALGTLSIAQAEARASGLLGVRVAAAACGHAEIALNVDRARDVALAERALATASACAGATTSG